MEAMEYVYDVGSDENEYVDLFLVVFYLVGKGQLKRDPPVCMALFERISVI